MVTTGPGDFEPLSVEMTFHPNDTERLINITVLEDDVLESIEQFTVVLSPRVGVARESRATILIEDTPPGTYLYTIVCSSISYPLLYSPSSSPLPLLSSSALPLSFPYCLSFSPPLSPFPSLLFASISSNLLLSLFFIFSLSTPSPSLSAPFLLPFSSLLLSSPLFSSLLLPAL